MSFSDTASAKKYASIAEVAAAQAKLNADKLENAPDYSAEAEAAALQAESAAQEATAVVSIVNNLSISASESAINAAQSASTAGSAAGAAIGRSVRAPDGESLQELPDATARQNSVVIFNGQGDADVRPIADFATIDENGKIPVSVIPSIALTEPFVVSDQGEMLALDAQVGDIAKRTDLGYSFCLASEPATTLSNWIQLTDDVLAQLGQAGGASSVGAFDEAGSPSTVQIVLSSKASKSDTTSQISNLQTQITQGVSSIRTDLSSDNGASFVGYKKGYTGEENTTAAELLGDRISLTQFGAFPDGTDITAKLCAALDAANGDYLNFVQYGNQRRSLYIPPGVYTVDMTKLTGLHKKVGRFIIRCDLTCIGQIPAGEFVVLHAKSIRVSGLSCKSCNFQGIMYITVERLRSTDTVKITGDLSTPDPDIMNWGGGTAWNTFIDTHIGGTSGGGGSVPVS